MRQALELALEALEEAWYHVGTFQPTEKAIDLYDEARAAIKEALAQPEHIGFMDSKLNPIQRTWVGLTDEEIQECLKGLPTQTIDVYARRIEAKLNEKNNG